MSRAPGTVWLVLGTALCREGRWVTSATQVPRKPEPRYRGPQEKSHVGPRHGTPTAAHVCGLSHDRKQHLVLITPGDTNENAFTSMISFNTDRQFW